jgi:hypothetical protein
MRRWHWVCGAVVGGMLLATSGGRAANPELVRRAVAKGVRLLKRVQGKDGTWFHQDQPLGMTALAGLTLLECGEPPSESHVKDAAKALRLACADQQKVHQTYTIALAIMFFDRLGEPGDEPLIQALTMRLMAGQNGAGGWGYDCPALPDDFYRKLTAGLQQAVLKARDPAAAKNEPAVRADRQEVLQITGKIRNATGGDKGDNSNTQFGTLGLWVARRHGQPVDDCLLEVAKRFENTQRADGGWSYNEGKEAKTTDTMTCAGLIGLAVGHGVRVAARDDARNELGKDPHVLKGLLCLAGHLGAPIILLPKETRAYYFFWSLERVAVIYRLPTIGRHNWYNWVAGTLLRNQQDNGAWYGEFSSHNRRAMVADTCFALLALKRANVASDLSAALRGDVTLKAGGVGGTAITGDQPADGGQGGNDSGLEARVAQLAAEVASASGDQQKGVIDRYKTAEGAEYTQALAAAIPRLDASARKQARTALAERLSGKTVKTLLTYFQDHDVELLHAAALAAYVKNDRRLVPGLIELLQGSDAWVARAAHLALRGISDKDFGPDAKADQSGREAAAAKWKAWWDSEGSRQQK